MKKSQITVIAIIAVFMLGVLGCPKKSDTEHSDHDHSHEGEHTHSHAQSSSEHGELDRDTHEHHGESEEESGTQLALDQTYNATRNGAQLFLAYNSDSNSFEGWVRNNTSETLKQVRVEVHLSNGKEIGPTEPIDLIPGQQIEVNLTATSKDFTGWTAHPEVGSSEHSHGEHGHEHNEHGEHV